MPLPSDTTNPNNPHLFEAIVDFMEDTAEVYGAPFYLMFNNAYDLSKDRHYYLNHYPDQPEMLYGAAGVTTDGDIIEREFSHNRHVTAEVAGMSATNCPMLNPDGGRANVWTFNTHYRGVYERIGELSLATNESSENVIYVVKNDGCVWAKPFESNVHPWRRVTDEELADLVKEP